VKECGSRQARQRRKAASSHRLGIIEFAKSGARTQFRSLRFQPKIPDMTDSDIPGILPARRVPLLDLRAQYAQIRQEVMGEISQVCESQELVLGQTVRRFEEAMAG
jgi:hypothetical protein